MGLNVPDYQSHLLFIECNVAILPVLVTKDLPISPQFSSYDFFLRYKFSAFTPLEPAIITMLGFYLYY